MKKLFGEGTLPVIMGSNRIVYPIMLNAHNENHTAKDITMATSRHCQCKQICKTSL